MRFPFRSGAIAPVALLLFVLTGAAAADARIQPGTALQAAQDAVPISAEEAEIRFVPGTVVQELPTPATSPIASSPSLAELVAQTDTSAEPSGDLLCLAQAVYFEARGESLDGQLAVAQVVINRAQSGRFADSYCGVVTQPSQFSFVRGGRVPSADHGSPAWTRAKAIAQIADQGQWRSEAGDALYFHADHVRPGWARARTARATIERHVFYR